MIQDEFTEHDSLSCQIHNNGQKINKMIRELNIQFEIFHKTFTNHAEALNKIINKINSLQEQIDEIKSKQNN